jgi:CubicO group peptidase (beta-lactamase class C family)
VYNYGDGASHLLSAIISQATGRTTLDFAQEFLFGPLGITDVLWEGKGGLGFGGSGLRLTPRDMAKFGYLYLQEGTWDGERVISDDWVTRSTESHFSGHGYIAETESHIGGYGYHWWILPQTGVYYASGMYEQRVFVVPDLDVVVVFTANNRGRDITAGLMSHFIFPACSEARLQVYSKHGIAFEYPYGMLVEEMAFPGEEAISDSSGHVQFSFDYPFLEIVSVLWKTVDPTPELEAILAGFYATVEADGVEINEKGTIVRSMKDEYELAYQQFNLTEQGLQVRGVVGTWYSSELNRVYIFWHAIMAELVTQEDMLEKYQRHLESFVSD